MICVYALRPDVFRTLHIYSEWKFLQKWWTTRVRFYFYSCPFSRALTFSGVLYESICTILEERWRQAGKASEKGNSFTWCFEEQFKALVKTYKAETCVGPGYLNNHSLPLGPVTFTGMFGESTREGLLGGCPQIVQLSSTGGHADPPLLSFFLTHRPLTNMMPSGAEDTITLPMLK